ncbi:hypothetical protein COV18_02720 [Candidatus Woesearchaeota archaeon CG10_big_fil_rev_8_21_14_0_10_37_12]|nr:MAG: hypothetical protein COV18_02720 [Candidatus Woesearchaeota archaeon CG10_big_fil_rev_8_21_14_0_10_37_12]
MSARDESKCFLWVPNPNKKPVQLAEGTTVIDVSSKGHRPFSYFSPFSHNAKYAIPIPGDEARRADSVEGIWQGLKIIDGVTDDSLFKGRAVKRRGKQPSHRFEGKEIGYIDARRKVYQPAFIYHAVNNALPLAWSALEEELRNGAVALQDVEVNGEINDPSSSYAHSSLLVELLNVLDASPLPMVIPATPDDVQQHEGFSNLQDQVDALVEYRGSLKPRSKEVLDDVITFAYLFAPNTSQEELKQVFALRTMKKADIVSSRLDKYQPTDATRQAYNDLQ